MKFNKVLLSLLVLALGACATVPNTIRLMDGEGVVTREVTIDPVMLSGLPWSENLKTGNYATRLGIFPQTAETYAEWDPLRVRYQAHAATAEREFVAHAVFAGYIQCLPRYFVFVEGIKDVPSDLRVVTLSTLLNRAYTAEGAEIKGYDSAKFHSDARYRKVFIAREGTALNIMRPVTSMERTFQGWNVYTTKAGEIITPLDEKQVKYLSGINPQYSYWEKVIGTSRVGLSLDYVSTAIGIAFDLINANEAKPQGFDYTSMISRRQQGTNLAVLEAQRAAGERSCLAAMQAEKR